MTITHHIETRLRQALPVSTLEIINESDRHAGPATDSHFKLLVVSEAFAKLRPLQRHQLIYKVLDEWINNPIHALTMQLYTKDEWQAAGEQISASPDCLGGSKGH